MTSVSKAGTAAAAVAVVLVGILAWRASSRIMEVGFWFDISSADLPADITGRLGGPLSDADLMRIEQLARTELDLAFSGLRVRFSENRSMPWRIQVLRDLIVPRNSPYIGRPSGVAESFAMGPLGGRATVSFLSLAQLAVTLAPPVTPREEMIAGIGRGIGRAAAHELAHFAGAGAVHDPADANSYEYPHAYRAAQFYGTLHWTRAWPYLVARLGAQAPAVP